MRLSEKQLVLFTVGISVVLILALSAVGYFIQTKKLKKAKNELTAVQGEILQVKDQLKVMEKLRQDVNQLKTRKEKFEGTLPTKKEVSPEEYIQTLNQLGLETNVIILSANTVESARPGGPPGSQPTIPPGLEEICYNLRLEGDFFDLLTFIWRLETYKRFIKVDKFDLVPKDLSKAVRTGQTKHTMNIIIITYTYTELTP